ncbi:MAG: DUF188 domain-containing protein, partial [bacterium]
GSIPMSDTTVYVDADACPVVDDVVELVDESRIVIVHNRHHNINVEAENVTVRQSGDRADAADHYIYNHLDAGDIVITDDLGLAGLVLGRDGRVLRFRGDRPTKDDIDLRLAIREAARRERQKSRRVSGPPEFTEEDRDSFRQGLIKLLDKAS